MSDQDDGANNDNDLPMAIFEDEPSAEENADSVILLGQMLVKDGLITEAQLDEALWQQREDWLKGKQNFLGQILVDQGIIKPDDLTGALVRQTHLPFLNILNYEIDAAALDLIPKEICQKHSILPLDRLGRILTVVICNPANPVEIAMMKQEIIRLHPDLKVKCVLCAWVHFKAVFEKHFGKTEDEGQGSERTLTLKDLGRKR